MGQSVRGKLSCPPPRKTIRFLGENVEHRDVHETTGGLSTLQGSVIGATVFPGSLNQSVDQHRVIVQSSFGSTRLMGVEHLNQLPAVPASEEPVQARTTLWIPGTDPE
jgi:hypothetical protein